MNHWQDSMLGDLVAYFEANEDVLGLLLFGSLSQPQAHTDDWSDIDLLIVVKDGALGKFFPTVEWLEDFGSLYTYSQFAGDFTYTTRVCFENFQRVDILITTETKLAQVDQWSNVPFTSGAKLLFSRSKTVNQVAGRTFPPKEFMHVTEEKFQELVRDFRFKSMLAVYKVVRQDLLIALHLAQDLVRDCCILAMMLRDRAARTNIHKQSSAWNQSITQWEGTQQPFTSLGILASIKASNEVFEKLAREWFPEYRERRQALFNWIEKAKVEANK